MNNDQPLQPGSATTGAPAPYSEGELARVFRPLTRPSIEAWELFWPLDDDQRREMAAMLSSYAAMLVVHHSHLFQCEPRAQP